jgi:hypothetical protein
MRYNMSSLTPLYSEEEIGNTHIKVQMADSSLKCVPLAGEFEFLQRQKSLLNE